MLLGMLNKIKVPQMNAKHCVGCEDNFYNGNNPYDIKKCWGLETATLIGRKRVGMNDTPPWNGPVENLPSCYKKRGYIFVSPERTC
jgi:hypothetical protein